MTKFSIIVPVRKINNYLTESLEQIKKLNYENFEVIIVTDDEETHNFIDSRFILATSGPVGPGEKRNIGAARSTGEILVFLDDDAFPKSDWLSIADKYFEDGDIYALGGPAVTPPKVPFNEMVAGRVLESAISGFKTSSRHKAGQSMEINDYPTVNLFVRKSAFERVGGFLTDFWPGEDTKLCLDLVKTFGKGFPYAPDLIVFHHRRPLFTPFLKQISRYGRHRGHFSKRFPETSRLLYYYVPTIFVLGLAIGFVSSFYLKILRDLYLFVVAVYLSALLVEAILVYKKDRSFKASLYVPLGIFLTHITYGTNFLIGLIIPPKMKLRKIDKETGNYLGG